MSYSEIKEILQEKSKKKIQKMPEEITPYIQRSKDKNHT